MPGGVTWFWHGVAWRWQHFWSSGWLQLADIERGVHVCHPIRQISQLIGVRSPARANRERPNPSGGQLAFGLVQRQVTCMHENLVAHIVCDILMTFVMLCLLSQLRSCKCNLSLFDDGVNVLCKLGCRRVHSVWTRQCIINRHGYILTIQHFECRF